MKKILALFLLFSVSNAYAIDLMRLYEMALDSDPQLAAAKSSRDSVGESRPQALAPMLPQISLSASATRTDRETKAFSQTFDSREGNLSLNQALLHFDHWIRLDQSKNSIAGAEAEYNAAELDLMLRVAEAYFNILIAEDTLGFSRAEVRAISRQLDQAKQRFDVGLIAVTDVHEAQAAYDLARANEIIAVNGLDGAWEALREIVAGYDGRSINRLRENIPLSRPNPDSIKTWTDTAMQRNPNIIAANNSTEVARKNIDLQRTGHLPTLDLVAMGNTSESDYRLGNDVDDASIGLQLSLPIYAGGGVSSKTRQARYDFQTAAERLEQTRRQVSREVSDNYRGVVSAISRVNALKSATRSADSALAATKAGFDVGTRTMVEVLNVQRSLYGARRDYSAARYEYILFGLRLKGAAGSLRVEDLRMINSLLKKG